MFDDLGLLERIEASSRQVVAGADGQTELSFVTDAERRAQLEDWAKPEVALSPYEGVAAMIEAQAVHLSISAAEALGRVLQGFDRGQLKRLYRMVKSHTRWVSNYRPEPFHADALHLPAADSSGGSDAAESWRAPVSGRFHVEPLPGGHESMLSAPHVNTLAERLDAALASVSGQGGTAAAGNAGAS